MTLGSRVRRWAIRSGRRLRTYRSKAIITGQYANSPTTQPPSALQPGNFLPDSESPSCLSPRTLALRLGVEPSVASPYVTTPGTSRNMKKKAAWASYIRGKCSLAARHLYKNHVMTWKSRYRINKATKPSERTPVSGINEIPDEATGDQAFRLTVDVLRITERCTSTGEPCYFLSVRDNDGVRFSVVAWESQWAKLEEQVIEGEKATLDVRVPVDGYASFTLAL